MTNETPPPSSTATPGAENSIDAYLSSRGFDADLKTQTVRSGLISLVVQGIRLPVMLGSLAILGRLLTPDDYGLLGAVTAITNFVIMFQDMGLPMATVQRTTITHRQVSNLFWLNCAIGLTMTCLLIAASPLVAWFYGLPRTQLLTCVLALGFFIASIAVQHHALLRRHMRFKALAVIDLSALLASTVCGIVLGMNGARYWALVGMQLTAVTVWAAGMWIACRWVPALPSRGAGIRPMLGFGRHLSGYEIVNYFTRNSDNVMIGRTWGTVPLGFYSRAYNLFNLPLTATIVPFASVLIPALSRLKDQPARFRSYYVQAVSAVYLLTMPLAVLMIAFPGETAVFVLGPRWLNAGPILQVLGVAAVFYPAYACLGWLFISLGRTRRYFYWGLCVAIVMVCAFLCGLPFGPRGVAVAYATALLLVIAPCVYYATRGTPVRAGDIARAAAAPVLATLVAVTTGCALRHLPRHALPVLYQLAIVVCAYAVTQMATFKLWAPSLIAAWQAIRARKDGLPAGTFVGPDTD